MLNVGGAELLIILLVALIFLGPQRLPEVARQLGQTLASLRSLASGFQAELDAASKPDTDSSMILSGPTDQAEAIASTQKDPFAGSQKDPFTDAKTDPSEVAKAAREVAYDDDLAGEVSSGGPTDLRDDEHSADVAAGDGEASGTSASDEQYDGDRVVEDADEAE